MKKVRVFRYKEKKLTHENQWRSKSVTEILKQKIKKENEQA